MTIDTDRLRERAARAGRLREWSDGPDGLFRIFDAVRANYLKTIADSEVDEPELRESTYTRLRALTDLRRAMETVIADGAESAAIINKLSEKQEKPRNVA